MIVQRIKKRNMRFPKPMRWIVASLASVVAVVSLIGCRRQGKPHDASLDTSALNPLLSGVWVKSANRSSPLDPVCDLMKLGGLIRLAVRLVRGVEVRVVASSSASSSCPEIELAVFSAIPWFTVRERYALDGKRCSSWKRRDLRRGKHVGRAEAMACGGARLTLEWGEPHAGRGVDEFTLMGRDEMRVDSTIKLVDGKEGSFHAVYYRRKRT